MPTKAPPKRRWPAAPLLEASGMELRALARRLDVDPALLCRPLTDGQADRYAVRIGLHPAAVWGPGWWA